METANESHLTPTIVSSTTSLSRRKKDIESLYNLNVRSFRPEDEESVIRICRTHFRSLCIPAVQYYCVEHFRDLIALLVIGTLFHTWKESLAASLLFLVYLFVRARFELEMYIYRDCPDLKDISSYYLKSDPEGRSNFWVAEATLKSSKDEKIKKVVGCVGCRPTRDDPNNTVQLLRLVVAEDARRMRNGSRLLAQFENFAIEKGFKYVRLYTNNLNTHHVKFIKQHGYEVVQWVSRTLMRGSLIQWRKVLNQKTSATHELSSLAESNECHRTPATPVVMD